MSRALCTGHNLLIHCQPAREVANLMGVHADTTNASSGTGSDMRAHAVRGGFWAVAAGTPETVMLELARY